MDTTVEYPLSWKIVALVNASLNFIAFIFCLFFMYALLAKKETRANAYNLYCLFLIFPDALNTLMTGVNLVIIGAYHRELPPGFSPTYTFCFFFYFIANCVLNAIVAHEVNTLVTNSHQRKKTAPPKTLKAYRQAGAVYFLALLIATWYVIPVQWSPFHIADTPSGPKATFGSPDGGPFSPKVSMAIAFTFVIFPILYVLYVSIRLWAKKLLPRSGRTRVLSLFFIRIIVIFVLFYIPNTLLSAVSSNREDKHSTMVFWLEETRGLFMALQAFVTLYMISMKDDIGVALNETKTRLSVWKSSSLTFTSSMFSTSEFRTSTSATSNSRPMSEWQQPDVYETDVTTDVEARHTEESEPQEGGSGFAETSSRSRSSSIDMTGEVKSTTEIG